MGLKPTLPACEVGVVQDLVGTAYDAIKLVADNLDSINSIAANIAEANVDIIGDIATLNAKMDALRAEVTTNAADANDALMQIIATFTTSLTSDQESTNTSILSIIDNLATILDRLDASDTLVISSESRVTDLETAQVTILDTATTQGTALDLLDTRVVTTEDGVETLSTSVEELQTSLSGEISSTSTALSLLNSRTVATEASIESISEDIVALTASITDTINDIDAAGIALSSLTNRVTNTENATAVNTSDITALEARVTNTEGGVTAQSNATTALTNRVTQTEQDYIAVASDVTTLNNALSNTNNSVSVVTGAQNTLSTTVGLIDDLVNAHSVDINALQINYTDLDNLVNVAVDATTSLTTSMTEAEDGIIALSESVTAVQATVAGLSVAVFDENYNYQIGDFFSYGGSYYDVIATQTPPNATPPNATYYTEDTDYVDLTTQVGANATAISTLSGRVDTTEGVILAIAGDYTTLSTTVGNHTSDISTLTTSVDGVEARWEVKTDVNGLEGRVGFYNDGTDVIFGITSDGINGLVYNVTNDTFEVRGKITITENSTGFSSFTDMPANIASLTGTEVINNQSITINANGTLSGAGAGQVTTTGIGAETPSGAQTKADAAENAAKNYADATFALQTLTDKILDQIDGNVTSWFYTVNPTLANAPANSWTTDLIKDDHVGDLYYNTANETAYRFQKVSGVAGWEYIWTLQAADSGIIAALKNASTAQDTADSKRRVFVVQPTGPYDIGDLWSDGSSVKRATADRATGYSAGEWTEIATVGATWGTNLGNIPVRLSDTPSTGLNLTATHLGFYDGTQFQSYMDNTGNFYLNGDASNYLSWDGSTLSIAGNITLANQGTISIGDFANAGALAQANSVDWGTQINGTGKPDDNATVGAVWGSNLTGQPSDSELLNNRTENNVTIIPRPVGASIYTGGAVNGVIVVNLPQGWTNTMMRMFVDVYNYATGESLTLAVGGYNKTATSRWDNTFAQITGSTASDNRVRFGINPSGKCCIVIGETTTVWEYPNVTVRDFQASYLNQAISNWADNWSITFTSSLTGYSFPGSVADYADALIDANKIVGQGALATASTADWATQVSGTGKPANNATVGAEWGVNLDAIPAFLETPSGTGLFVSNTRMGYLDAGTWRTYMDNAGHFYLNNGSSTNSLIWNGSTLSVRGDILATSIAASTTITAPTIVGGTLAAGNITVAGTLTATSGGASAVLGAKTLDSKTALMSVVQSGDTKFAVYSDGSATFKGGITITSGNGYGNLTDKPTSIGTINALEGSKLAGIADGATVGATWGSNINGQPSDTLLLNNLIDSSIWEAGQTGDIGDFVFLTSSSNQSRVLGNGPHNVEEILWKTVYTGSSSLGGFLTPTINVNNTKSYRLSIWAKRTVSSGQVRLRINTPVTNIQTASNHTWIGALQGVSLPIDEWCLLVTTVLSKDTTLNSYTGNTTFYEKSTGAKGVSLGDYKFQASTTTLQMGVDLSAANASTEVFYARPRIDLIDGSEPTIEELLGYPNQLVPETTQGLNITATHLGYYDGSQWQSYMDNQGFFYLNGDANNYLAWNGTTLEIKGTIEATSVKANTSISSPTITGGTISGNTITGSTLQTASGSVERVVINSITNSLEGYWDSGNGVEQNIKIGNVSLSGITYGAVIGSGTYEGRGLAVSTVGIDKSGIYSQSTGWGGQGVIGYGKMQGMKGSSDYGTGVLGQTIGGLAFNARNGGYGSFRGIHAGLIPQSIIDTLPGATASARRGEAQYRVCIAAGIDDSNTADMPIILLDLPDGTYDIKHFGVIQKVMPIGGIPDSEMADLFYPIDVSAYDSTHYACLVCTAGISKVKIYGASAIGQNVCTYLDKGLVTWTSSDDERVLGRVLFPTSGASEHETYIKMVR